MIEPQTFLPKKGNYQDLIVYQKAECIYVITFFFTKKFLSAHKDRTVDQMVQAARSGWLIRPIGLIGLICLITLASCSGSSSDDLTAPEKQDAITFSSTLSEDTEVTRATSLSDVQTTFKVWGYKNDAYTDPNYTSYQTVMPGFTVNYGANTANTTTSNTHDWEYVGQGTDQTIKYWDWGAKAYRFFGVAPADATYEANEANGAYTISATVDASSDEDIAAAPYFSDLWFSTGDAVTYPDKQFGSAVQLTFRKPFARVRFIFIYADGINIKRERLYNPSFKPQDDEKKIATAGKVTVTYPLTGTSTTETWASSDITSSIDKFDIDYYEADAGYTPQGSGANLATTYDNTPQKWYTVLPQSLGNFVVSVQVVTDDYKTAVVPAQYMNWKAGYEYTYKFKITESGGVVLDIVQVGINSWVNQRSVEHEVYNW